MRKAYVVRMSPTPDWPVTSRLMFAKACRVKLTQFKPSKPLALSPREVRV